MLELGFLQQEGLELILCKQSDISYPRHNHASVFVFGLLLDGALELVTDSGAALCRAGDGFALPPYAPHCVNARPGYTLLSLCVPKAVFRADPEGTARFLRQSLGRPELERGLLEILRGFADPVRSGGEDGGLRARLEAHPERRWGVEDMAAQAFVSKYHLIRSFKKEVGLTPHQFQIQNRVRLAQRLLRGPGETAEVALAAGFCDQSHLIRHFKKLVGLTPEGYRRSCGAARFRAPVP